MGFFKKIFKPVRKVAKKIIPKEVRPFLPYIAAGFGPATAGLTFGSGLGTALAQRGLIAAATSAATDEQGDPLRAGLLAIAPDVASQGLGAAAQKFGPSSEIIDQADKLTFAQKVGEGARRGKEFIKANEGLKTIAAQTAIDQSAKFAEIRQDEIDEYNRQLEEQGVLSKKKRRQGIYDIYISAGYDPDYTNSVLDKYGYAEGGLANLRKQYEALISKMKAPETVAKMMSGRLRRNKDEPEDEDQIKPKDTKDPKDEEEPVEVSVVKEEPDFVDAMLSAKSGVEQAFGIPFGGIAPAEFKRFADGGEVEEEGIMSKIADSMGRDYDYFTRIKIRENLKQGETMEDAADLAEQEAMDMVMNKYTKGGFARGGEVEIEEETDDLGIMDLMRDQGVEYGEQVSAPGPKDGYDDIARQLFGKGYKDLTPEELEMFQEELERLMNKFRSGMDDQGIMQMASGYKTDIEEMYEQYVFEMEEQGLEPMSFSQFLARERAGMKDGGKTKRRKKGQEDDTDGEKPGPRRFPKFEDKRLYEEKMPQVMPGNKPDMMDAAMGGIASMADGGIMEKDMRGGGFIPEGSKERADDVPARLSKNEFVMTADAVRAAGGGSVNKGAKRMYDMMYSLEGKV